MKRYVKSVVVNDRSISSNPKKPSSKHKVSQEDIRNVFEQGVAQSKLAGHAITYYSLGKPRYGNNGWVIHFSLSDVSYRFDSSYPLIYFPTLYELTPEIVAEQINRSVDDLYLVPNSVKQQLEARLDKMKQEYVKAVEYCLDKYDCEGDYNSYFINTATIFDKYILVDIDFTSIAGLPVKDDYIEYNGKRCFISGLYLNGDSVSWIFDKSYEENLAALETAFSETINKYKDKLGINMDSEEARTFFEQKYKRTLSRYVQFKQIPINISNIEVSERNGELYLTFDISAYDGKIDMTVEFSKSELDQINLWNKLDSMLKYRKRKLGI